MMGAKRKKEKLAHFTDIQKRKNQEIVDLRKRTKIINWAVIIFALIIGGWLFYGAVLKADIIYFYPSSALGNWQNVDKAGGEINLDFDADLKDFNENNSAIFEGGGIKQIFLGNFQNPSLTETSDKEIISAKLKINFRIADKNDWIKLQQENKEINLIEPTPTLIIIPPEQTIAPSESASPEITNSSNPETTTSPNPTNLEIISTSSEDNLLIEETPSPINQPVPEENPTTTPISLLKTLFKKVFAQDSPEESLSETLTPTLINEPSQEPISKTPDLIATPENSPIENSEIPTEAKTENPNSTAEVINTQIFDSESTTPLITSETSSTSPSATPPPAPLFIIKYTLDGENWQILANIANTNNYSTEFDLPITEWDEIATFQIAIESTLNTNLEENLIAFLDGAQLEVDYHQQPQFEKLTSQDIEKLQKVQIDLSKEQNFKKKHFKANEPLEFEINIDELPVTNPLGEQVPLIPSAVFSPIITEQSTSSFNSFSTETSTLPTTSPSLNLFLENNLSPTPSPTFYFEPSFQPPTPTIFEDTTTLTPNLTPSPGLELITPTSSPLSFIFLKNHSISINSIQSNFYPNVSKNFFRSIFPRAIAKKNGPVQVVNVNFWKKEKNRAALSYELPYEILEKGNKIIIRTRTDKNYFQPGEYSFQAEIFYENKIFVLKEDFSWGVLTINANKSIYLPNETAYLQMAALDSEGHTICDAKLNLFITTPKGEVVNLSTENNIILKSGKCGPNNVTDVPDYFAYYQVGEEGTYQIKLTNLDNGYEIEDIFEVRNFVPFDIERSGPTRIYPLADYEMKIKIKANEDYRGEIREKIPNAFEIKNSNGVVETMNPYFKIISWSVNVRKDEIIELKYAFDAPDVSPYIYLLGPLQIGDFKEARQWQIASDAVARMILLWDPADGSIPSGWTCISCASGDDFYQRFIRGNSTYGGFGGSDQHTHPASTGNSTAAGNNGGGTSSPKNQYPPLAGHVHDPATLSGLSASNLPQYRQLRVIRYDNGIPTTLPQNIIAIFDSTPPSGWSTTQYNDGRYIRGESSSGEFGDNTHSHTVSGVAPAEPGGTSAVKNGSNVYVAAENHTHNCSGTASSSASNEPPYITVILAKQSSAGSIPSGIIAMFDATPPSTNWSVNSGSGQAFYQRIFKPTGSYGLYSDISTHTHNNLTLNCSTTTNTVGIGTTGTAFSLSTHTHSYTVSFGSAVSHLPPYRDAIFAKASSSPAPNLTQSHYHWRNDNGNEVSATSATGGIEDATTTIVSGAHKRLRIEVSNKGTSAAENIQFRLEYGVKTTSNCSDISVWTDVGASGGDWDMYNSTYLTDGTDTTNISVSTGGVTNENPTFKTPNYAVKDTSSIVSANTLTYEDSIEMEFSITPATTSGTYCFRVTNNGSTTNFTYSKYPEITVIEATLNLTLSTSTVDLGVLVPQIPVTAVATATVEVVGYDDGYYLSIKRNNSTSTLALESNPSITFPDYSPAWDPTANGGSGNATITPGSVFSFRLMSAGTNSNYNSTWWGANDNLGTAKFGGMPSGSTLIMTCSTSACQNGTTTNVILYRADAPIIQPIGNYTGEITITALGNL